MKKIFVLLMVFTTGLSAFSLNADAKNGNEACGENELICAIHTIANCFLDIRISYGVCK